MIAYPGFSYTSGAPDAQPSSSAVETVGPETYAVMLKQTLTGGTLPGGWIQEALDELDGIAKLGQDWDSYGADPPSILAIVIASNLLLIVNKEFSRLAYEQSCPQLVAPCADGGIQIEWGTRPVEIAVHVDSSGTLGYLYTSWQGDIPKYKEVPSASWGEILQLIVKVIFTASR
jgi:hypothetical protein